jgi:[methyl-Co(III) methanol-specific corrinoid protein]:coenzyme M methyltransferase
VLAPRERLVLAVAGRPVDRPPAICPGGMMTMATRSAMRVGGAAWPRAHTDPDAMARLVLATQQETGLECLSVPFCMTVEAEALGCEVHLGTATVLPHVAREALGDIAQLHRLPAFDPERSGRAPVVLEAIRKLAAAATPYPVFGAVVGPVSLAAMIMEAAIFLRLVRRDPSAAERLIRAMEAVTLAFALAQRAAGADCVLIAEPSATGEVLGAGHFARLALPALSRLLAALRENLAPAILHVCGDLRPVLAPLATLGEFALSVDAMVSGRQLAEALPRAVRIGNVDAFVLQRGPLSAIEKAARRAAREFHVVSPACGLVPTTPARHLRALVQAVRDEDRSQAPVPCGAGSRPRQSRGAGTL